MIDPGSAPGVTPAARDRASRNRAYAAPEMRGPLVFSAGANSCQGAYMAYTFCSVCHLAMYQLDTTDGTVLRWCEDCDGHLAYLLPA